MTIRSEPKDKKLATFGYAMSEKFYFLFFQPNMYKKESSHDPQAEYSILNEADFKEFIEFRKIRDEDIQILKSLSRFPNPLFVEFHNFFNLSRERSAELLQNQLSDSSNEQNERREFLELLYKFASRYDWTVCWNLVRIFEKRVNKK